MEDLRHSYSLLGLEPGASPEEARRAFRGKVALLHPDRYAGDPRMQVEAQERLRLVIEAYRRIAGDAACRKEGGGAGASRSDGGESAAIMRRIGAFLASGPNLLFALFGFASVLMAFGRFGVTLRAAACALEFTLVPLLFSVAWNLAARGSALVRGLYVGFTLFAALVAMADGFLSLHGGGNGSVTDSTAAIQDGLGVGGSVPAGGGFLPSPAYRDGEGVVPARLAPRAPLAPLVPEAPLAPMAPAAPVVPAARR